MGVRPECSPKCDRRMATGQISCAAVTRASPGCHTRRLPDRRLWAALRGDAPRYMNTLALLASYELHARRIQRTYRRHLGFRAVKEARKLRVDGDTLAMVQMVWARREKRAAQLIQNTWVRRSRHGQERAAVTRVQRAVLKRREGIAIPESSRLEPLAPRTNQPSRPACLNKPPIASTAQTAYLSVRGDSSCHRPAARALILKRQKESLKRTKRRSARRPLTMRASQRRLRLSFQIECHVMRG